MLLKVVAIQEETPTVRRLTLAAAHGGSLPGFDPGAHLAFDIPGVGKRKYSLITTQAATAMVPVETYMVGVRRDDAGLGGSLWMHGLAVGDTVHAASPENDFTLAGGDNPVVLLAGGIGITPLISMAACMKAAGRPFRMIYAARSSKEFAFLTEIKALAGETLTLHADDDAGGFIDIKALIDGMTELESIYVCGPKLMVKAALQETRALGWAEGRLRFELFYSPAATGEKSEPVPEKNSPDATFEVVLKSTGAVYTIPPDRTIVSVLVEAGVDPLHDCDKGECGVCQTGVIEGIPDHRDSILSETERASGKVMQICVSRASSPRLVLDL